MNTLKCIVVDDSELDRLTIRNYLSEFPEMNVIGIFENPVLALEAIQISLPDVIFLDVDMPEMSGIELRKKVSDVPICIFTTDHPEYAVESFELETLDYLLKPYSLERFSQSIARIHEYMDIRKKASEFGTQNEENTFFVKDGHKRVKINMNEILYLNSLQNYTAMVTATDKQYVLSTLSSLLQDDHFRNFIRSHKSYAVQKKYISSMDSKEITLTDGTKIPIGRSYKNEVENLL